MPAAAIAAVAASHASVRVSSSVAQAAIRPQPPRPHAAPMSPAFRRNAGAPAPTPRSRAGDPVGDVEDICAPKGRGNTTPEPIETQVEPTEGEAEPESTNTRETQVEPTEGEAEPESTNTRETQ